MLIKLNIYRPQALPTLKRNLSGVHYVKIMIGIYFANNTLYVFKFKYYSWTFKLRKVIKNKNKKNI